MRTETSRFPHPLAVRVALPVFLLAVALGMGCKDKKPEGFPQMSEIRSISPGLRHTCAVRKNGAVYCWGRNFKGRLGIPDVANTERPDTVDLRNVADVTAGPFHTCAVTRRGFVFCWGFNGFGELGDGTKKNRPSPVEVKGLRDVKQLTAFAHATCALDRHGQVWCWGGGGFGLLGNGDVNNRLRPTRVPGLSGVVQIDAGAWHACAATKTGEAWCWGMNGFGETGNGTPSKAVLKPTRVPGLSGVVALAAGGELASDKGGHSCALLRGGTVRCWGSNHEGQLGDDTQKKRLTPVAVKGLKGITQITAGFAHTCALDKNGQAWCWGRGREGQLGTGRMGMHLLRQTKPYRVTIKEPLRVIATNATHTCAVTLKDKVLCWGAGASGQLGVLIAKEVSPEPNPVLASSDY